MCWGTKGNRRGRPHSGVEGHFHNIYIRRRKGDVEAQSEILA